MLDFRIKTFMKLCETMNFTKAGEALGLTQPAVSQQIHFLEDYYDDKLFSYQGKKLSLTEAGRILLESAYRFHNDEETLKYRIKAIDVHKKVLNFGVTRTVGDYYIAKNLANYVRNNSNTEIKMLVDNTEVLLEKMYQGEISFAIVEGYYDKKAFDSILFAEVPFIAVASKDYGFIKGRPRYLADLLGENLLVREEGSGTRAILERHLSKENLSIKDFKSSMEIGGINAILQMLELNMGISFMYYPAVEREIEAGKLQEISLVNFKEKHSFSFIWIKDSIYSDEYKNICKNIQNNKL